MSRSSRVELHKEGRVQAMKLLLTVIIIYADITPGLLLLKIKAKELSM